MPYLVEWNFNGAKAGDYIWGKEFIPGAVPVNPRMWSRKWGYLRKELNLPKQMVLYSLRDSGIIQLLQDGVSPEEVMIHADHSSLEVTSIYVKHARPNGVESVKSKGGKF
jgi:hypothetical protein